MEQLTVERSIWVAAPRERVWQAVTDPEQVAQWLLPPALGAQMKRDDGGKISVCMGGMEIPIAIVESIDPPRRTTIRGLPDRLIATTTDRSSCSVRWRVSSSRAWSRFSSGDNVPESSRSAEPSSLTVSDSRSQSTSITRYCG